MPTLLLSQTCQPEADQLALFARQAGWGLRWLKGRRLPATLPGKELVFYGETDLACALMRDHDVDLIEPTLDLLAQTPRCFTNREIECVTLEAALQWPCRAFIKPADCTNKCFDAAVCEEGKYLLCADDLPMKMPVLVSEPVSWDVEYRVIVLDRQIVTFSPYIRDGWLARSGAGRWSYPQDEAAQMLRFCERFLTAPDLSLPPAFTLDVGLIPDRGWSIVEFNPVWCSGLLGCDLQPMLAVLQRVCRRRNDLLPGDVKWVIERS